MTKILQEIDVKYIKSFERNKKGNVLKKKNWSFFFCFNNILNSKFISSDFKVAATLFQAITTLMFLRSCTRGRQWRHPKISNDIPSLEIFSDGAWKYFRRGRKKFFSKYFVEISALDFFSRVIDFRRIFVSRYFIVRIFGIRNFSITTEPITTGPQPVVIGSV